ncbi:MAG TPA: amidohydrolase family protein [Gemmataceae bacterium]
MIDTHIHVEPPRLPGVGPLSPLLREAPEAVAAALAGAMEAAGVTHALAMGSWGGGDDDPLGVARTLEVAGHLPGLYAVGVADPHRTDPEHLRRAEAWVASGRVRALKVYLGYLHFGPEHPNYRPYYEMAARFRLPVIFHTGDTYSPYAKLRFAHPLGVDEVAVDHPDVRFVIAHVGSPWTADAAEVIYKNFNVWADVSGLLVGDEASFANPDRRELIEDAAARLRQAFRYAERPNRFLFGTDWPLAPMAAYRDFARAAIPEAFHPQVFEENARMLFGLPG